MRQYSVRVVQALKGSPSDTVVINQIVYGSVSKEQEIRPGERFLFAAVPNETYNQERSPIGQGWYQVGIPGKDHIRVVDAVHQVALVASFKEAILNETVPDPYS
jgi:hypothetical protein